MTANGTRKRRWLVWGLGLPLALVATAFAIRHVNVQRRAAAETAFAALSQRDRNLTIYDAFRAALDEHYYDRKLLDTPEWQARFAEWREKAAAQPDAMHLYTDVFFQLAQKFPHSHIGVKLPESSAVPLLANVAKPAPGTAAKARADRMSALWDSGPGFDLVQLRRGTGFIMIVGDVISGSPADRAGIEPGWSLTSMSIKTVEDTVRFEGEFLRLTPEQARDRERGLSFDIPATTREEAEAAIALQKLKIAYDYEPLPKRSRFASSQMPGGVTYLRFDSFADTALVDCAVSTIDAAGPAGLILDLRHNTGGLVSEVQRFLERLLAKDSYIGTAQQSDSLQTLRTGSEGPKYAGPLAVLIGPGTISGGEVTAAAVADNKRGRVIGRTTSGAVLYSLAYPLPGGWQVALPVSDYVRADGRRIEGVGVEPDIRVVPTLEDVRAGRDPVLERALVELRQ